MNYLSVEKVSKTFAEDPVLRDATFGLDQGDKVAIIGVNGGGKSTLLKIIAGTEFPDSGQVQINKNLKFAFLDQNPEFTENISILDAVLAGDAPLLRVVKAYHHKIESGSDDLDDVILQMDSLNAWDFETTINQMLGKLGIEEPSEKVHFLSGGMKKRVALAKTLIEDPDLLILDEPTNHLDLEAIEWLENYLANKKTTLLLVSHDRYFMDRVCNAIVEIDDGQLYKHKGDYVSYLQNKEERKALQKLEVSKARNLLSKELEWLRRQPKARGTKSKYRVEKVHELQEASSKNTSSNDLNLSIGTRKQGKKIAELRNITKSFSGRKIIENFTYTFKSGEKIGIVGKNGSGKSTFLNILTQLITPESGEINPGQNTIFGYYKQEEFPFSNDSKVIDAVKEVAEVITTLDGIITASQLLNQFMFPPKRQYDLIGKLSGGEKKRLQLLRVLIENPNFLILDEPTNDLDIVTLNILEEYLMKFSGCLLLVSHDRYFIDRLVDHLFIFDGKGQIQDFGGNYTDYRASVKKEEIEIPSDVQTVKSAKPRLNETRKLNYKEKQELQTLQHSLKDLEAKKIEIADLINSGETDHKKLADWGKQLKSINEEIDNKEFRWLELEELAG